jgi:hypothetical protein
MRELICFFSASPTQSVEKGACVYKEIVLANCNIRISKINHQDAEYRSLSGFPRKALIPVNRFPASYGYGLVAHRAVSPASRRGDLPAPLRTFAPEISRWIALRGRIAREAKT